MIKPKSTGKRGKSSHFKDYSKAILKVAIKVKNCRKCSVSNSESSKSEDDSLDKGPPKCCHYKKVKPMTEVDEEVDNEQKEVKVEET